jgi:hypothetical protein
MPTEGYCDVMLAIHIDRGSYGNVSIGGLNAVIAAHVDGAMGGGGWKVGLLLDETANEQQREALQAILSGAAGGPMGALAPLIGEMLGVKYAPITFIKDGRHRSVTVPNTVQMAVDGMPSMNPDSEVFVASGHPFNPEKLAMAIGAAGSTYNEFGMRWDNSGKNGHYAELRWSA